MNYANFNQLQPNLANNPNLNLNLNQASQTSQMQNQAQNPTHNLNNPTMTNNTNQSLNLQQHHLNIIQQQQNAQLHQSTINQLAQLQHQHQQSIPQTQLTNSRSSFNMNVNNNQPRQPLQISIPVRLPLHSNISSGSSGYPLNSASSSIPQFQQTQAPLNVNVNMNMNPEFISPSTVSASNQSMQMPLNFPSISSVLPAIPSISPLQFKLNNWNTFPTTNGLAQYLSQITPIPYPITTPSPTKLFTATSASGNASPHTQHSESESQSSSNSHSDNNDTVNANGNTYAPASATPNPLFLHPNSFVGSHLPNSTPQNTIQNQQITQQRQHLGNLSALVQNSSQNSNINNPMASLYANALQQQQQQTQTQNIPEPIPSSAQIQQGHPHFRQQSQPIPLDQRQSMPEISGSQAIDLNTISNALPVPDNVNNSNTLTMQSIPNTNNELNEHKQRKTAILGQPPNSINVNVSANNKYGLRNYLVRARRILRLSKTCVICGIGNAVSVACEVVEVLKRERIADVFKIETSIVEDETIRPSIDVTLSRGKYAIFVSDFRRRKVIEIFEKYDEDLTGKLKIETVRKLSLDRKFQADNYRTIQAQHFLDKMMSAGKERRKDYLLLPEFIHFCSILIHPLLLEYHFKMAIAELGGFVDVHDGHLPPEHPKDKKEKLQQLGRIHPFLKSEDEIAFNPGHFQQWQNPYQNTSRTNWLTTSAEFESIVYNSHNTTGISSIGVYYPRQNNKKSKGGHNNVRRMDSISNMTKMKPYNRNNSNHNNLNVIRAMNPGNFHSHLSNLNRFDFLPSNPNPMTSPLQHIIHPQQKFQNMHNLLHLQNAGHNNNRNMHHAQQQQYLQNFHQINHIPDLQTLQALNIYRMQQMQMQQNQNNPQLINLSNFHIANLSTLPSQTATSVNFNTEIGDVSFAGITADNTLMAQPRTVVGTRSVEDMQSFSHTADQEDHVPGIQVEPPASISTTTASHNLPTEEIVVHLTHNDEKKQSLMVSTDKSITSINKPPIVEFPKASAGKTEDNTNNPTTNTIDDKTNNETLPPIMYSTDV